MGSAVQVACGLAAVCMFVPVPAQAQSRSFSSDGYYERQTEHAGPRRGYSGWVWGGNRGYYCDYQRIPNRECTTSKSGKRHCRVKSWTLKQYCY